MKSHLIILGCGSSVGVPRIDGVWGNCDKKNKKNRRTRCSALIIKGKNSILIDTSPDIKHQLSSNKIKNISSVVFTHKHADQTNGLFELRPFFWKNKKKINIYADSETRKYLSKTQSYLFNKTIDYKPILKANNIGVNFSLGKKKEKVEFQTFRVKHGKIKSVAYVFEKSAYISDSNDMSIVDNPKLKNLNYLIIDCLKFKKHPSHFSFSEALFIHKMLKPKKTILTNLHHDLDFNYLKKRLPKDIFPAFDGLKIKL